MSRRCPDVFYFHTKICKILILLRQTIINYLLSRRYDFTCNLTRLMVVKQKIFKCPENFPKMSRKCPDEFYFHTEKCKILIALRKTIINYLLSGRYEFTCNITRLMVVKPNIFKCPENVLMYFTFIPRNVRF